MTELTLCLIARDEERFLPGCLASVEGVVDRIVVVDTGSTDRTIELARAAGAEVVRHAWNDDFSAARNAAVEQVDAGYVLVLDADERLAPGAGEVLRAAVDAADFDAARLPLINADREDATPQDVVDGRACAGVPVLLDRVFRRTADLRWEGVVHEHVTSWARRGRKIVTLDAPIVHYGAIPDVRARLGKSARNLRLLERAVADEPDNPVMRTYLAQDLLHAGDEARAAAELDAAWKEIAARRRSNTPAPISTATATMRAFLLLRAERYDDADAVLRDAREWDGEHPNLSLLSAVSEERRWFAAGADHANTDGLRRAELACLACLDADGKSFATECLPGATSWVAATRLGTLRLLMGDTNGALQAFDTALAAAEDHCEAQLGRAECLVFEDRSTEALELLTPLLETGEPDAWTLAAFAGLRFEGRERVAPMIERAIEAAHEREWVAPHRRWMLIELESLGAEGGAA